MISTRDLASMPDIVQLKRLSQSLAMLDAIIEPDWQARYYSFDARWAQGETMASMRDGSGDHHFIIFGEDRAIIKGFGHRSPMTPYQTHPPQIWPGVLDEVPTAFADFQGEPAFAWSDVTFCLWRQLTDTSWQRGAIDFPDGDDPDGSAALLAIFDGEPETYQTWAQEYYERSIDLNVAAQIYRHQLLSASMVTSLNGELSLEDVEEDATEIGYPLA